MNINVTNPKAAQINSKPKEKKTKVEQHMEFVQDFRMLDLLFSFIGAASFKDKSEGLDCRLHELNQSQDYTSMPSRQIAGTTDVMPGENPYFKSHLRHVPSQENPVLLPVSCGYFLNIVKQLLSKQRKPTLRYMLLEAKGVIFDKLVEFICHDSLANLLIELMQVNFPMFIVKPESDSNDDTAETSKKEVKQELTEDQKTMIRRLQEKKELVLTLLIKNLSHTNTNNVEDSLNSMTVLTELIETERSLDLFFQNDAKFLRRLFDLSVDPMNNFNHKYLLNLILTVVKTMKPQNNNIFKDLDEDSDKEKKFDPETTLGKQILKIFKIVSETNYIYNLLLLINTGDRELFQNQQFENVPKIG